MTGGSKGSSAGMVAGEGAGVGEAGMLRAAMTRLETLQAKELLWPGGVGDCVVGTGE